MWTPGERRGALMVAALLTVGTLHDAWRSARPPLPPPAERPAPSDPRVPAAGVAVPIDSSRADRVAPTLDLTTATAAELDALPGIGPVLAGRILAERRRMGGFRRVEDLLAVPGIGPRLFERLAPRVRVGPAR